LLGKLQKARKGAAWKKNFKKYNVLCATCTQNGDVFMPPAV